MKLKKFLLLVLVLAVFFSMTAGVQTVFAGAGVPFTYTLDPVTDTITITGYTEGGGAVVIPSTINGKNVTAIGDKAFYINGFTSDTITSVIIPNGVTTIGFGAFGNRDKIAAITIPSTVTSIGDYAFSDEYPASKSSLSMVYFLGNSAVTLGSNVFRGVQTGFTIYYESGKAGFAEPTFYGYASAAFDPAATYTLAYDGNGNTGGSVPAGTSDAKTAEYITVSDNGGLVKDGYQFRGWSTTNDGTPGINYAPGDALVMGIENVTLYARWDQIYTINKTIVGNGSITIKKVFGLEVDRFLESDFGVSAPYVYVTVTPDSGWKYMTGTLKYNDGVDDIIIDGLDEDGSFVFQMPQKNVVVSAKFNHSSPLTVGTGGDYATLTEALAVAVDGDTITLLDDITESVSYTVTTGAAITIDGQNHKITSSVVGTDAFALILSGNGIVNLKNLTLLGGTAATAADSRGLTVYDNVSVQSDGIVNTKGGSASSYSTGLTNYGSGTVNVTAATGDAAYGTSTGLSNIGSGTVNVTTATGGSAEGSRGVDNSGEGTVNVTTATGGSASDSLGVVNSGAGTVNVTTATGDGNSSTSIGVSNTGSGTVNVTTATGSTNAVFNGSTGMVNTGADVATVTLNKGTGASCVLNSITVAATGDTSIGTLPSVYKGEVQGEWYTDSAKTIEFSGTTVTGATSLYSTFFSVVIPGGGGGYIPPVILPAAPPVTITETPAAGNSPPSVTGTTPIDAKSDPNGNASASVTQEQLSDAVDKAVEAAAKNGEGTTAIVDIKVNAPADAKLVETTMPKAAIDTVASSKIDALTVSTPVANLTFDADALDTISGEATGDVKITASNVDASTLSEETKQVVGDRPVFNFSVTSGDKTISQFGGNVTVSVPYTPKEGEDPNAIVIYYINADGKLETVSNCAYDRGTGMITFKTNHFSKYAVGYNKVAFKDVAATAWYSKAVDFVAARGISTGTGDGNFSPEAKLTRGQFLVMVMKAYGIAPDENPKDNFADAGNTYYTGYLAAAKRLGITGGVGSNMYAPDKEITRQEMFTLLYNTLKLIGELPEGTTGKAVTDFTDAGTIATWAKEAMTFFVGTGTIGGNNGLLLPVDTTNRAQMAQVLFSLLSK